MDIFSYRVDRNRFPYDDILLMMDNLNLHRSRDVKNRMDELGFLYCWTPKYSPMYNGVEEVINIGRSLLLADSKIASVRLFASSLINLSNSKIKKMCSCPIPNLSTCVSQT